MLCCFLFVCCLFLFGGRAAAMRCLAWSSVARRSSLDSRRIDLNSPGSILSHGPKSDLLVSNVGP